MPGLQGLSGGVLHVMSRPVPGVSHLLHVVLSDELDVHVPYVLLDSRHDVVDDLPERALAEHHAASGGAGAMLCPCSAAASRRQGCKSVSGRG